MVVINKKYKITYEIIFTILAIIAVIITLLDLTDKINLESNTNLKTIDDSILIIFIIDYVIRILLSKNKKYFIKNNIPDLIAIIPFNSLFKIFRITKLLKLTKLSKLSKLARFFGVGTRLNKKVKGILNTNGLNYSLWFAITIISLGSIGIYISEKGTTVNTFEDAIWWSFVTATTVGYGDISPSTQLGRIIAGILMLTGIGTIGMITGSISTYFIKLSNKKKENNNDIKTISQRSKDLSLEEIKEVLNYIDYLKSKRKDD